MTFAPDMWLRASIVALLQWFPDTLLQAFCFFLINKWHFPAKNKWRGCHTGCIFSLSLDRCTRPGEWKHYIVHLYVERLSVSVADTSSNVRKHGTQRVAGGHFGNFCDGSLLLNGHMLVFLIHQSDDSGRFTGHVCRLRWRNVEMCGSS